MIKFILSLKFLCFIMSAPNIKRVRKNEINERNDIPDNYNFKEESDVDYSSKR